MFEILPAWILYIFLFALGAIIGSFLNVVIYRFHTGKSINGQSHCLSCLKPLVWYELFPLLSYLTLRGRCRSCYSHIPPRYFLVESLTAIAFVGAYTLASSWSEWLLLAVLACLFIMVAVYDIYHFIIPDEFVIGICTVALIYVGLDIYSGTPLFSLVPASLSALGAFIFFGGLWLVSGGRWIGFGDAKLVVPLAFMAGFPQVLSLVILAFWVGAAVSVVLLVLQKITRGGKVFLHFLGSPITIKSEIPFAPFLLVGFILSTLYGVEVLELMSHVF